MLCHFRIALASAEMTEHFPPVLRQPTECCPPNGQVILVQRNM